jgi:glucan 1,3-beta-glucosidase
MAQPLRGVNLGGWLILEPWITPSLFKGTNTPDEFTFCDQASPQRIRALQKHHKTWIARQDFQWLAEHGFQAVRIPVGYWIFGDTPPYVGSISYLDKAFGWAEEFGLKVLVCLHGAPGSQNGMAHSGRRGEVSWYRDGTYIDQTLQITAKLARRYRQHPALLGIELLNEPSKTIPRRTLITHYRRAYKLLRRELGSDAWIVFDDRFRPWRWWWVLHWPFRSNVVQDHHHYQMIDPRDKMLDLSGHLAKLKRTGRTLRYIASHRKIIVGEWSAALDSQSLKDLPKSELPDAYASYIQAQLAAYNHADGWFYWTYRTEAGGPWSLRHMIENGIFPDSREV